MTKVRLYNQVRTSNEGEGANISQLMVLGFWSRMFRIFHLTFVEFQPYQSPLHREGGLTGLDDQIYSCHSEISYPRMPRLSDS